MRYLLIFLLLLCKISFAQSSDKINYGLLLVDTHNDFLSKAVEDHVMFDTDLKGITHSDLRRMQEGGVKVQFFSIFCDDHYGKGSAFKFANQELDTLFAIVGRNTETMQIVYSYKELGKAVRNHKIACLSGVEGGHMMEDNLGYLDSFYKRGVRYMTLTWNNSTSWATSALDESNQTFKVTSYGLKDFGKSVVKKMNQIGMMIDISHVGEKTFWDVISTTTKPVIASHSSVYAICPVYRNLKDDQIRAIAKNGGVIQVNFYSVFLDSTYSKKYDSFLNFHRQEYDSLVSIRVSDQSSKKFFAEKYKDEVNKMRPPLSLLLDHIDYIVKLVGINFVGLGSDFDGIDTAPLGLDGVEDYPKITDGLLQRGYSRKEVEKILGGNLLRVFKAQ
jgi:membrane dipeptidase